MKRIYLSPSNQEHNAGVGKYGTEEVRMHELAGMVAARLKSRGFAVKTSKPDWEMSQVVADSNAFDADAHICIHTNAGGGDGTIAFYGSARGKALNLAIYKYVAKESPGSDEGVRPWAGLYEIAHTNAPTAYLELFFHDNYKEVGDFLADKAAYSDAIAHGICDYFGVEWARPSGPDYRPTKKAIKKLAAQLGIDHSKVNTANSKGAAFEALLRAVADYKD